MYDGGDMWKIRQCQFLIVSLLDSITISEFIWKSLRAPPAQFNFNSLIIYYLLFHGKKNE